ncbi:MAG TPA: LacI family DNA-binding transcriptional regulator [Actinomycetes bacterium]|nr:LacI family DNA-binding transcriptional regulator [Actinomycetes bacterium]
MPRRPTIEDVARDAGVSKGAVSFALNDRPGVAPATRDRILRVAADLGWTPSHRGRALAADRALAVGLVVARPPETLGADPFFPAFIAGIEATLAPLGQVLVLQVVADREREVEGYRRLAADGRVDGVFLTDLRVGDPRPALLERLGLPAVVIAPSCRDHAAAACVCVDDRPGIVAAVEHLAALGHRRIAHVSGPADFVHSRSRRDAWAGAVRDAGLRPGPAVESDFSAAGGAAATARLLDLAEPPTAVVYANDLMAIAGAAVAAGRGLDVPTDLSVTGFDDTEVAAHLRPALTTIRTDAFGWGRAAADRLTRLVRGTEEDTSSVPPATMPPPRLVVRDSTAPPRPDRSRTSPGSEPR